MADHRIRLNMSLSQDTYDKIQRLLRLDDEAGSAGKLIGRALSVYDEVLTAYKAGGALVLEHRNGQREYIRLWGIGRPSVFEYDEEQPFKAPGSGSASAEAVPGDSVGHDHTGDAASPSAPSASSPHPRQGPLSYQPFWDAGTCQVCHRPLPLCEC